MPTMPTVATLVFLCLALMVCLFQAALVLGAPWGVRTLGGRWVGRLPVAGRIIAALSFLLMLAFALVVCARAGWVLADWRDTARLWIWIVVAYCALGTVANAATRSRQERRTWLPVVGLMLLSSLVVATA